MSRVCEICGKKKISGGRITRRGLPKKKGGIGMQLVKDVPRKFYPNLQRIRVKTTQGTKRLKVCTACIRSGRIAKP